MPKPVIVVAGIVGAVVVVGGAAMLMNKKDEPTGSSSSGSSSQASDSTVKLNDPDGTYDFFSDPSVTKYPEKGVEFGNGQMLSFEYDGSKTNNDQYATLSYQLYYIAEDGKVQPMGGGNMEGTGGKGTFTVSNKVFNSSAKDRSGFLELQATVTSGTTGKNINLGMYPIKFTVSE